MKDMNVTEVNKGTEEWGGRKKCAVFLVYNSMLLLTQLAFSHAYIFPCYIYLTHPSNFDLMFHSFSKFQILYFILVMYY